MDVRSLQKPLKEQYRRDPSASRITLTAKGAETATPMTCSVDIGRAIYQAEAHKGVGGTGTAACSVDLLLGALAVGAVREKSWFDFMRQNRAFFGRSLLLPLLSR